MNIKDDLMKAVTCGAVAGVASHLFLTPGQVKFPFMNFQMHTSIVVGSAVAGASLISDFMHDMILPHINKSQKLTNIESALLNIAVAGGATGAILIYGSGASVSGLPMSFMLGAGSVVGGNYIFDKFVSQTSALLF